MAPNDLTMIRRSGHHRVLLVGRSQQADIRLRHASVSRLHLELVLSADGDLHIADRSSRNGTWRRTGSGWEKIAQTAGHAEDRLRLGDYEITVAELIRRASPPPTRNRQPSFPKTTRNRDRDLPTGKVRRNPKTGDVRPA